MRYNNREAADFFSLVVARLPIGSAPRHKMLTADPVGVDPASDASECDPSDGPS
jgi:hypothetical protein